MILYQDEIDFIEKEFIEKEFINYAEAKGGCGLASFLRNICTGILKYRYLNYSGAVINVSLENTVTSEYIHLCYTRGGIL